MANVAKSYAIGDTVYVWVHNIQSKQYSPQAKVVAEVDVTSAGNAALVKFTDGTQIDDSTPQRVFTTAAACATAIINQVITDTAACVVLEGGASTALVRN